MNNPIQYLLLLFLVLVVACTTPKGKNVEPNDSKMDYRSISFHIEPDSNSIIMGAEIGFNDICIQTEGDTEKRLKQLREAEERYGYMKMAKSLGMSVSVWIREISNYDKAWGDVSLENEFLWQKMNEKYDYYMTELIPEADNFILTVVESQINIADNQKILLKVIDLILKKCEQYNKKLILRTFVHHPHEFDTIIANLKHIPDEVTIMTKFVPSDWNLRGPDNFLIGKAGKKDQIIEIDLCGEYWRNTSIPNCWTGELTKRFNYWKQNGCDGISVRIDRSPREGAWWEPIHYYHKVYSQPQEVNLWTLAYLSTEINNAEEKAWKDWSLTYFGENVAKAMVDILVPQGEIVAEALHVETEPFGSTRNKIPAEWTMNGQHCKCLDSSAIVYNDSSDMLYRSPFFQKYSPNVWNPSLKPRYHEIRKGHPDVVMKKSKAYKKALDISETSIFKFINLKKILDDETYRFYHFKLQENKFHLQVMCEAELAWLKANQLLYFHENNNTQLETEIHEHLSKLEELNKETDKELVIDWHGSHLELRRGEYIDIPGFIELFNKYWKL